MKWITYKIVCNEDESVLIGKKIGYSEANLAIAEAEAYNGEYTIEEDSESLSEGLNADTLGGIAASGYLQTSHAEDDVSHVTSEERTVWNAKQSAIGFTPVQQGGGTDQLANKIYVGWSGSRVKMQVDATDMGNVVFDNHLNSHTQPASRVTAGTFAGQVIANASAVANLGTKQIRNIYAGTTEMVAGTTSLSVGDIYVQLKV